MEWPMNYEHIVITRLNIGVYHRLYEGTPTSRQLEEYVEEKDLWTENKLDQAEKWLFPSLENQTVKGFRFVLILSEYTNKRIANRAESLIAKIPNAQILLDRRSTIFKEKTTITDGCGWPQDLLKTVRSAKALVTTRIDSDDFAMPTYVEAIQGARAKPTSVIDFKKYYYIDWKHKRVTVNEDAKNATEACSLIEPVKTAKTVYQMPHTKLRNNYPMDIICDKPHWCKRVHYKARADGVFDVIYHGQELWEFDGENYYDFMDAVNNREGLS